MAIYGYLTDAGERLVADKLLNGRDYTISSVSAGTGPTPLTSASFVGHEQTLTLGTPYTDDQGVTVVTVTLIMANANRDYDLAELAVYARNIQNTTLLFKIFKVSPAIRVTRGEPHTLQFLLKDTNIGGATGGIAITPDAAMTNENYFGHLQMQHLPQCPTVSVSIDCIKVTSYLDSLPNYLDKHYEIKVSGSFSYLGWDIKNKYGPGSITIDGNYRSTTSLAENALQDSYVLISNCNLSAITIKNLRIGASYGSYSGCPIYIENAKNVFLERLRLDQSSYRKIVMIGSHVSFKNCVLYQPNGTYELSCSAGTVLQVSHVAAESDTYGFTSNNQTVRFRLADKSNVSFYGDISQTSYPNFIYSITSGQYTIKTSASDPTAITRIY